ncbi:MAG: hypothetical protein KGL39_17715 [Patescibacteria group bacterium]|nr:hypothetical protein [Patescibacteria group bacterium]
MTDPIQALFGTLEHRFPWLLLAIGAARLVMKWFNGPLQARLTARMVAAATGPDSAETRDWALVLSARGYRVLAFALDLLFSVKLPTLADFLRLRAAGKEQTGDAVSGPTTTTGDTMKKIASLILIAGLTALALPAGAQTATNPAPVTVTNALPAGAASTLWDFLTTGSNYWVAPYSTMSTGDRTFGGGIAIGYRASAIINPVVRLDYFGGHFWMPSLTAQLQPPQSLMGKIPIIPFAIAGGATPISGAGGGNGQFVSILGAGAALRLDWVGSGSFWQHTDLAVDYEKWLGLPSAQQNQIRFGLVYKF